MLEMVLALAIVTQDQTALRAAPQENAARHAMLTQGDNLEVRGVRGDYLQVYDHRRERAGYVRATQVGRYELGEKDAPRLRSVLEFLKDLPGQEALGIAHAAAFLKAAPARAIDAGSLAALGGMADRLAARASQLAGADNERSRRVSDHLDLATSYGVTFYSVEHSDKVTLCYEGDAWRRVLAMPATIDDKARAALALTRHECVRQTPSPAERLAFDQSRADTLEAVLKEAEATGLAAHLKNRLKMRAAGVWAGLAGRRAQQGKDAASVLAAGMKAEASLAGIDKAAFGDGDRATWHEAAVRVGASRWAALSDSLPAVVKGRPGLALEAGAQAGQTCVRVVPATLAATNGKASPAPAQPLVQCTYGHVWGSSLSISPDGKAMTLAVQPLESWREMWVFRQIGNAWVLDIIPPAVDQPELGYLEFAGWVPGNKQFLAAREVVENGRVKTSFELWSRASLNVEKKADKPANLSAFYRWQAPEWKGGTVAVR